MNLEINGDLSLFYCCWCWWWTRNNNAFYYWVESSLFYTFYILSSREHSRGIARERVRGCESRYTNGKMSQLLLIEIFHPYNVFFFAVCASRVVSLLVVTLVFRSLSFSFFSLLFLLRANANYSRDFAQRTRNRAHYLAEFSGKETGKKNISLSFLIQ